jgi:hypothetical protein
VKTQQKIDQSITQFIIIFAIKNNIIVYKMDEATIYYTAENQILSNLCLEYYNETNEYTKKILFVQIQEMYLKKEANKNKQQ